MGDFHLNRHLDAHDDRRGPKDLQPGEKPGDWIKRVLSEKPSTSRTD